VAPLVLGLLLPVLLLWARLHQMAAKKAKEEGGKLRTQLRHSQKFEMSAALTVGLIHDLNNVFTAMLGSLEMLQILAEKDEKMARHVNLAYRTAFQGAEIMKRVLAFSRGGSQVSRFDVCAAIRENEELLRLLAPKVIRLVLDFPDEPIWVMGDKTVLLQVIMNLVVNARDAVPEHGGVKGHILLTAHVIGDRCSVSVDDNGCGIPEEIMEKVFEPLFTTKPVGKGTGLGLTIVRDGVKALNGKLHVRSTVGQGTVFWFDMPVDR
jgi:signal transduction histidine kinase